MLAVTCSLVSLLGTHTHTLGKFLYYSLPPIAWWDSTAHGGACEGLMPEGRFPRLRTLMFSGHVQNIPFGC